MSQGREIRCYDYVNHPYEQVRDALRAGFAEVFSRPPSRLLPARGRWHRSCAPASARLRSRPRSAISVKPWKRQLLKPDCSWNGKSASMPHLFPFMQARVGNLSVDGRETQLDFHGLYEAAAGPGWKSIERHGGTSHRGGRGSPVCERCGWISARDVEQTGSERR